MADSKQYERVGREAIVDLAREGFGEFREEYLDVVDRLDDGGEPTAEELADLREAYREVQYVVEERIAPLVDGTEPWHRALDRVPAGVRAEEGFGVPLERLQEADPDAGDLDEE